MSAFSVGAIASALIVALMFGASGYAWWLIERIELARCTRRDCARCRGWW